MNNKRTSVGVLCAILLAVCVLSLAAYISAKLQAELEREAEILQLRQEINRLMPELIKVKERQRLELEELEQKASIAEAERR